MLESPRESKQLLRYAEAVRSCLRHTQAAVLAQRIQPTRIVFDVSERIPTATTAKALVECGSKIGAPPLDASRQARGRFVLLYLPRHCLLDRKLLGDQ